MGDRAGQRPSLVAWGAQRRETLRADQEWVELGECGLAHPELLSACGLRGYTGLAMGIGLDRAVMLRKGIDGEALGDEAAWVEEVAIVSRTPYAELAPAARERIGIGSEQENLLVRIVLRHPARSLPRAEANALRDRIYAALHEGGTSIWATSSARSAAPPSPRG